MNPYALTPIIGAAPFGSNVTAVPLISGPLKFTFWCSSWIVLLVPPLFFVTNDILPLLEVFVTTARPSVPPLKFISLSPAALVPVKFNCPSPIVRSSPTNNIFSIPTPPSTIKAPVSLLVLWVVPSIFVSFPTNSFFEIPTPPATTNAPVVVLEDCVVSPTNSFFEIPTPPVTTKAPVSLFVLWLVSVIINEPILVEPPT